MCKESGPFAAGAAYILAEARPTLLAASLKVRTGLEGPESGESKGHRRSWTTLQDRE